MAYDASRQLADEARDRELQAQQIRDEADRTARALEDEARDLDAKARDVQFYERSDAKAEADAIDRATRGRPFL
jgi:hypothetical protein